MLGAICGDVIGSVYEHRQIKTKVFDLFDPFCRFTDDTVLTVAVAYAIVNETPYSDALRSIGRLHPHAGYGRSFIDWLRSAEPGPYGSWGNGSAMRVSPVGFAFDTEADVLAEAERTAVVTHDHPEGVKGAQATALSVFLARKGATKETIRERVGRGFEYDLNRSVKDIRPSYAFDVSCQGSVPQAIIAFLDSESYEDAVRNAISLGGDSDTLACIAGGIAEAFYGGVPEPIWSAVKPLLTPDLLGVIDSFRDRLGTG